MWIPLSLSSLELAESFKFVNLDLLTNLGNFQPFKYFFSASHFLSSPLTPLTNARCFGIVHHSLKSYLFIFYLFTIFCSDFSAIRFLDGSAIIFNVRIESE